MDANSIGAASTISPPIPPRMWNPPGGPVCLRAPFSLVRKVKHASEVVEHMPRDAAVHSTTISIALTDAEIYAAFEVMNQLRPNLARADFESLVRSLMDNEGFRLATLLDEGAVRCVAGYRVITMLYRGRILVVDDLVTDAAARSRGCGARMISWLKQEARRLGCEELQLISRLTRTDAHRFYVREGFRVECVHFIADA